MVSAIDILPALTATDGGSFITIEVSAGSRRETFPTGYNPWRKAVGIQVKAPAVEGKANTAIITLIAATLRIPGSQVRIATGQTSSVKRVFIAGYTPELLAEELACLPDW